MHRTHWHRQLWISALECKQTTETMTQDDNAEVKIDLNNCCLNTAFTMMRFISCEPCSSVQIIIAQCTRHVQSWHTCFFLRTCFFFTWQRMRRNGCFPQLTKRRATSQLLQPLRERDVGHTAAGWQHTTHSFPDALHLTASRNTYLVINWKLHGEL